MSITHFIMGNLLALLTTGASAHLSRTGNQLTSRVMQWYQSSALAMSIRPPVPTEPK
jgi:hypothetical protein